MRKHVLCLPLLMLSVVLMHAQSSTSKSTAVSNSSDPANVRDRQALLQLERDIVKAQLNGDTGMVIHWLASDNKSLELKMYLTHPFALTDATGSCLGIYLATAEPGLVSIENK
jgi:hypothetical protein